VGNDAAHSLLDKAATATPQSSRSPFLKGDPTFIDSMELANLRYAKFTIDGIPGEKHAVFISDQLPLKPSIFEEVCYALGTKMPSMMLCGVSSLRHPAVMTTPELRDCPAFEKLMGEARSNLGLQEGRNGRGGGCLGCCYGEGFKACDGFEQLINSKNRAYAPVMQDADWKSKAMEDFANNVMEKKITSVVNDIANAAFQTNAWIFTGPLLSNFELFLQRCIDNGTTEVFRSVTAHMQDKAYMESKLGKDMMKQLFENSEVMSVDGVESFEPIVLSGDLWNPSKNFGNPEFSEFGMNFWSFESVESEASSGHPVLQWPWPWADLFFLFYREKSPSVTQNGPRPARVMVDWCWSTEKRHDREAIPVVPDMLAPLGYVFMAGEQLAKKKLLHTLQVVRPVVILDNTPGVSKQMSILLKIIKKALQGDEAACKAFLLDSKPQQRAELLSRLSPSKILKAIDKAFQRSCLDAAAQLTLSDVVCVLDLVKQRPQVFKHTITVVDPLHDQSDENTLPHLTSTFCSLYTGAADIGASQVSSTLVLKGWRLHSKLVQNATQLRYRATVMEVVIATVMLLSTALALVVVFLDRERNRISEAMIMAASEITDEEQFKYHFPFGVTKVLRFFMLLLPVTGGILMTLQAHFQFFQKWAHVHLASHRVVAEIYQFLGGAGRYSSAGAAVNRQRFLKRLQDIMRNLSMSGIREDDFSAGQDSQNENFTGENDALQRHINLTLYGIHGLRSQEPLRDALAPLNAEMYMETRVAPLMTYYNEWAKSVSKLRTQLHVAVFSFLGIGSGLAAFGMSLWIPIIMVAVLCLSALVHWLTPLESLMAVNNASTMLQNLELRWHGSGICRQRSEDMQNRLIVTTERIMLAVAATLSQAPLMPEEFFDNNEREEIDNSREVKDLYRLGLGSKTSYFQR
jgi:hypothetical protein